MGVIDDNATRRRAVPVYEHSAPGQYIRVDGQTIARQANMSRTIALPAFIWAWIDREGMNAAGRARIVREIMKNAYAVWRVTRKPWKAGED